MDMLVFPMLAIRYANPCACGDSTHACRDDTHHPLVFVCNMLCANTLSWAHTWRSKSAHPLRGIEQALACGVPSSSEHAIPNGLSRCCAGDGHGVRPGYHPAARRPCALKPCPAASLPPRSPQAPHSTSPLGNCSDQVDLYSSGAACRVCVCCSNATPRMLATSNTNTNGTRCCQPFRPCA